MDEQKKWEEIAAYLHGENDQTLSSDLNKENQYVDRSINRILESSKDVKRIKQFQASETIWETLKTRLCRRNYFAELFKYAAVILFAVVSTLVISNFVRQHIADDQYASILSPIGQITNLTLFDGTNVWLNAGSTLKYKKSFNRSEREVFLEGEAYFEVVKNTNKLFVVNAGDAKIKVHGTTFDVKASVLAR